MMLIPRIEQAVVVSGARTATFNSEDISDNANSGGIFFLNITAASGTTPTLDVKLQMKSVISGIYIDIPGAAFAQKVTTGTDYLVVQPNIAAVANKAVSQVLSPTFRLVATIGGTTPSFTFAVNYVPT